MTDNISDEMIEYVAALAKLDLTQQEKQDAGQDMGRMLNYIERLNQLDTDGIEPMSHAFTIHNVFRDDRITNQDRREEMLANAPDCKEGAFKVPKTVE